jgi:hypothetical protein
MHTLQENFFQQISRVQKMEVPLASPSSSDVEEDETSTSPPKIRKYCVSVRLWFAWNALKVHAP